MKPTGTQVWIMLILAAARTVLILGVVLCALGISSCFSALSADPGDLVSIRLAFQYAANMIVLSVSQFLVRTIQSWYTSSVGMSVWMNAFKPEPQPKTKDK